MKKIIVFLSVLLSSSFFSVVRAEVILTKPNLPLVDVAYYGYIKNLVPDGTSGSYQSLTGYFEINGYPFYYTCGYQKYGTTQRPCENGTFVTQYPRVTIPGSSRFLGNAILSVTPKIQLGTVLNNINFSVIHDEDYTFDLYAGLCYGQDYYLYPNNYTYYYGFELNDYINSKIYYGWMKLSRAPDGIKLLELAYETIPNTPVVIGSTVSFWNPNTYLLSGIAFEDLNNNCTRESNEPKLANMRIRLRDSLVTTTDASGRYNVVVTSVNGSNYSIRASDPQGLYSASATCASPTLTLQTSQKYYDVSVPMTRSGCGNAEVTIHPRDYLRCFVNNTTIDVQNKDPLLTGTIKVRVIMPPLVSAISSNPAWTKKQGDTLWYTLPSTFYLNTRRIVITDSVHCYNEKYLGVGQCVQAEVMNGNSCFNGNAYTGSDIISYGYCTGDQYEVYIKETGQLAASDSTSYAIYLNDTLVKQQKILLQPNDSILVHVSTKGKSLLVKTTQDLNHPLFDERNWIGEGCGNWNTQKISKGYVNYLPYTKRDHQKATYCSNIRGSYDPNDKAVTPNRPDNLVEPGRELSYRIRFQNTGTAEAYHVRVLDTISEYLNLATIRNIRVSHPSVSQVMIDYNTRVVRFQFVYIHLPDSTTNEPGSHGYVEFTIDPYENIALGSSIKNTAAIYFDFNSPVITNTTESVLGEIPKPTADLKWMGLQGSTSTCENATLNVKAKTKGVQSYTWYNQEDVIVSSDSILSMTTVAKSVAGNYSLKLSGPVDTVWIRSIGIQVLDRPVMSSSLAQTCSGASMDLSEVVTDENALLGDIAYYASLEESPLPSSVVSVPGDYWAVKTATNGCKDTTEINYVTQLCTNTNSRTSSPTIRMYPNPTQDFVILEAQQTTHYKLLSSDGRLVDSGVLNVGSQQLDMRQRTKGVYLLQLQEEGSNTVYRETIIVQ